MQQFPGNKARLPAEENRFFLFAPQLPRFLQRDFVLTCTPRLPDTSKTCKSRARERRSTQCSGNPLETKGTLGDGADRCHTTSAFWWDAREITVFQPRLPPTPTIPRSNHTPCIPAAHRDPLLVLFFLSIVSGHTITANGSRRPPRFTANTASPYRSRSCMSMPRGR